MTRTMKKSGVDWIGDIPADWDCQPLRYLACQNSEISQYKPSAPYIALEHIESWNGRLLASDETDGVESLVGNFRKGDVLFGKLRPYLAKVVAPDFGGQSSTELISITPKKYTTEFLYWALINKGFIDHINALTYGVKMPRTSWSQIKQQYFPLPSEEEQKEIALYLDKQTSEIDTTIDVLERQILTLERHKRSLIYETVTKGLDPNTPMKPSGVEWIGEVPEHWSVERVTYHAKLESGHTPSTQHPEWWIEEECVIPWLTTSDVHKFRDGKLTTIYDTEEHVSKIGLNHSSARILPAGTVGLSRTASVGFSIIMGRDMASSQDFADWVPEESLDSRYLLFAFRAMTELFEQLKLGSTHKTIYMHVLKTLKIPVPSLEEQKAIAEHLEESCAKVDAILEIKRKQVEVLRKRRQSLIYEYVTGKRRVGEES